MLVIFLKKDDPNMGSSHEAYEVLTKNFDIIRTLNFTFVYGDKIQVGTYDDVYKTEFKLEIEKFIEKLYYGH